jgi:hypothetical protein
MQIDEGEVKQVPAEEGVQCVVTSCLTVTCIMSGLTKVGAHYSLMARTETGGVPTDEVCRKLREAITGQSVAKVIIGGQTDYWNTQIMRTGVFDQNARSESLIDFFTQLTGCNNVEEHNAYDLVVVMGDGSYLE